MSDLLTEQNFRFAVTTLLPGFIALAMFMMAFRTRLPPTFYIVVLSVILSFFYENAKNTLEGLIPFLPAKAAPPIADMVNLVIIPGLLGYGIGEGWERLAPRLRDLGIPVRSPIPTAWDYAFAKRSDCWVLVRFKDKDRPSLKARYTKHGFAGTDLDHKDIYLTEVHEWGELPIIGGISEDGWLPVTPPLAIWISGSEIHSIEFDEGIPLEEENVGQQKAS